MLKQIIEQELNKVRRSLTEKSLIKSRDDLSIKLESGDATIADAEELIEVNSHLAKFKEARKLLNASISEDAL